MICQKRAKMLPFVIGFSLVCEEKVLNAWTGTHLANFATRPPAPTGAPELQTLRDAPCKSWGTHDKCGNTKGNGIDGCNTNPSLRGGLGESFSRFSQAPPSPGLPVLI